MNVQYCLGKKLKFLYLKYMGGVGVREGGKTEGGTIGHWL